MTARWSALNCQPIAPAVSSIYLGRLAPHRANVMPDWLIVRRELESQDQAMAPFYRPIWVVTDFRPETDAHDGPR
jgi:hypothetical protein